MAVTPRPPHGEKTSLKQALLIRVANIASDMRRQEPTFGLSKIYYFLVVSQRITYTASTSRQSTFTH